MLRDRVMFNFAYDHFGNQLGWNQFSASQFYHDSLATEFLVFKAYHLLVSRCSAEKKARIKSSKIFIHIQ